MERLQKVIAHAGVASRRKSEELILEGRVTVNGAVVKTLGQKVSQSDRIEVNGIPIYKEHPVYYLFYKPKNVLSSVSDDRGRPVIGDYFHHIDQRVYPIGRLDFDTTGLLLVTNDGEFANLLMHPRYKVDKTYVAKVTGIPSPQKLRLLERGVKLGEKKTSPAVAKIISADVKKQTSVVQLTIREGWNHQVKNMFAAIGHPVVKLKRERFGFLTLEEMKPGSIRELKPFEVDKLRNLANQ